MRGPFAQSLGKRVNNLDNWVRSEGVGIEE